MREVGFHRMGVERVLFRTSRGGFYGNQTGVAADQMMLNGHVDDSLSNFRLRFGLASLG